MAEERVPRGHEQEVASWGAAFAVAGFVLFNGMLVSVWRGIPAVEYVVRVVSMVLCT